MKICLDGRWIEAAPEDTIADAILRDGKRILARSVKYHRPRGPLCAQGWCEGCLMRVDGAPNVMTCQTPAREGAIVETQNVLGTAERDLLAMTDWFFPRGIDHHEMFTQHASLNAAMKIAARKIAGVGKLPDHEAPRAAPAEEASAQLLIIGHGAAGHAAFRAASAQGVQARQTSASLKALAIYPRGTQPSETSPFTTLLRHASGQLCLLRSRAILLATGTRPSMPLIPGADLPGVFTLSAQIFARRGVRVGARPLIAYRSRPLERIEQGVDQVPMASIVAIEGSSGVERVRLVDGESLGCDALWVEGYRTGAVELAIQAGARTYFDGEGFFLRADDRGRTHAPSVFATGALTGRPDDHAHAARAGIAAAQSLLTRADAAPFFEEEDEALTQTKESLSIDKTDKIVLCRCEDVLLQEFEEAVQLGYRDLESVKRFTGFGTGWCQGKSCAARCARALIALGGEVPQASFTPRPPLHPIALHELASLPLKTQDSASKDKSEGET